ncbi:MAG TPA: hypothetical protein VIP70_09880 [Nitrososphaeraceae archaeon]|jgi:hypothetical protein
MSFDEIILQPFPKYLREYVIRYPYQIILLTGADIFSLYYNFLLLPEILSRIQSQLSYNLFAKIEFDVEPRSPTYIFSDTISTNPNYIHNNAGLR